MVVPPLNPSKARSNFVSRAAMLAVSCALIAFASAGCSKTTPVKASEANKDNATPATAPAKSWSWENYPASRKMKLGLLPCQLMPKSSITVHSPLLGSLHVYITQPQTNLDAGMLWAEFEPQIFAAEEKSLVEAEQKLTEREKLQTDIEVPRQKLTMERQIEEMGRQVSLLRMLSTNKELADLTFNVGDANNPLRPDSLAKSELELQLMSQSLKYLQETNLSALGIDYSTQRTDLERRRLDFERRRAQARFKMPFSGKLTLTLPYTEGVTEYPVNVGQEIAVARDLSSIRLRVPISNVSWTALNPESLTAIIRLPTGEELHAPFAYQKIERQQNREESVYYFQLTEAKAEVAARLIGTDVSCELWTALPKPTRIVPKMALVMHQPNAFQGRTWINGLAASFPGASLMVEGQTDLGLVLAQDHIPAK
ncbi:MAG: hypothetical protein ACO1QB_16385 [Verrucomicrobiales bacterium]